MQTWQPTSKIYVLRSCDKNFSSYNGFQWPKLQGWAETPIYVECPDWKPTSECGNGLHGYVEGKGNGLELKLDGLAQIVEVEKDEIIYLEGKCKFPRCNLLFCGSYKEATDFLLQQRYSHPILKASIVVGDGEVAVVGNYGSATAGTKGIATAGNEGTATAGYKGTATAGHCGTAAAGYYGTATAGENGEIRIRYYDTRNRTKIGYIGENGLLPNVKYRLNEKFEFEEVK